MSAPVWRITTSLSLGASAALDSGSSQPPRDAPRVLHEALLSGVPSATAPLHTSCTQLLGPSLRENRRAKQGKR